MNGRNASGAARLESHEAQGDRTGERPLKKARELRNMGNSA